MKRNHIQSLILMAMLTFSFIVLLTSCATQEQKDAVPALAEVKANLDALSIANAELQSRNDTLLSEKAALQAEIDTFATLKEKYGELSESELTAQTEANNLKAEQDRIAQQKLLAEEQAKKEKEEAAAKAAAEAEAKKGYDTGITFNQLSRTPDDYEGKKVKFKGKVIQVVEGSEVNLRIATKQGYDEVIYVHYSSSLVSERVLKNDIITIYGVSEGLYTYKSTAGGNITIPSIKVDKIDQ